MGPGRNLNSSEPPSSAAAVLWRTVHVMETKSYIWANMKTINCILERIRIYFHWTVSFSGEKKYLIMLLSPPLRYYCNIVHELFFSVVRRCCFGRFAAYWLDVYRRNKWQSSVLRALGNLMTATYNIYCTLAKKGQKTLARRDNGQKTDASGKCFHSNKPMALKTIESRGQRRK